MSTRSRERDTHGDFPAILPATSERRLSTQITRVVRGTFGATTGLRTLMQSIAAEMLAAGATEHGVTQAFETYVLQHPARPDSDSHSLTPVKSQSAVLVELANESVAAAAAQSGRNARRKPLRR